MAPGAQIVLVEANSQSLSDLMGSVVTAANQPGVSVVSMSWGFPEGQAVLGPGRGDLRRRFHHAGRASPSWPAPATTARPTPNTPPSRPTWWRSAAPASRSTPTTRTTARRAGVITQFAGRHSIGSGGGVSQYEPEPAYQQGVQSTGNRTTPDVSFVADPATGVWIADPYNLPADNPWEVVGGTSLSAPAWAGLIALVNQGRSGGG